jgi:hypothetical protein
MIKPLKNNPFLLISKKRKLVPLADLKSKRLLDFKTAKLSQIMLDHFNNVTFLVKKINQRITKINDNAELGRELDIGLRICISQHLVKARSYRNILQARLEKFDSMVGEPSSSELVLVEEKEREDLEATVFSAIACLQTYEFNLESVAHFTSPELISKLGSFRWKV